MFGNIVPRPQVGCEEDHARGLRLAPLETDEYWAYTPDGYVFVSDTRPAVRNADDVSEWRVGDDETCF
jgi:hypothetical protein